MLDRRRARWIVALAILVAAALGVLLWSIVPGGAGFTETGEIATSGGEDTGIAQPAAPARIRGRVLLEREEGEELDPPPTGRCRAQAWRAGVALGEPAVCDADGRFALELPGQAQEIAVELLVSGRLRAVLESPAPAGAEVELPTVALGFAAPISGQVIDGRGDPVAGVKLEVMPAPNLGEPEPWRAQSDAAGRFTLDTLPPGASTLRAFGDGFAPTVLEIVAPEDGIVVPIERLVPLAGEVVGPPELLARARVRVEGSSVWPPIERPVAADGSFHIDGLTDGLFAIDVVVPATGAGEREYASIPLENVPSDTQVSLALIVARRVPVRVVGPQGEPVPDARVTLGYGSVGLLRHTAKTDADGRARVGPVVPGPYMISADADGFLPSEPIGVDVRGDVDPPEHLLTLIAPAGIAGKVVDHGGRAIAGARVVVDGEALYTPATSATRAAAFDAVARPGGSLGVTEGKVPAIPMVRPSQGDALGDGASFTILTDGAGTFQLGALMPGTYRLRAVHDRFAESDEVIVDLAPGQQVTGVRLVLGEGALISGRVRDENGQPIAGVRVEFEDGAAVYTDDRGVFDAGLRRGRQVITLRKQGLIPQVIELDVGEQPVDLERVMAVADGEFEARVRDGNNQPIADVRLSLDPDGELAPVEFAWTDKRGVVELRGLVPGRATVTLEHPDFATVERRVQITTAATLVEFTLEEGWSVIVVVRDEASRDPLADATVEAFGRVHRVGVDGSVVLDQLAVDSFSVTARAPGRVPRTRTVRRDGDDEVLVDLDEGGAVEGQVQDDLGEPVAGAAVRVERRDGEVLARTRTRIDGSFAFQGLGVGDVYVVAEPPIALRALLAETSEATDILGGRVTRDVIVRLQRK